MHDFRNGVWYLFLCPEDRLVSLWASPRQDVMAASIFRGLWSRLHGVRGTVCQHWQLWDLFPIQRIFREYFFEKRKCRLLEALCGGP